LSFSVVLVLLMVHGFLGLSCVQCYLHSHWIITCHLKWQAEIWGGLWEHWEDCLHRGDSFFFFKEQISRQYENQGYEITRTRRWKSRRHIFISNRTVGNKQVSDYFIQLLRFSREEDTEWYLDSGFFCLKGIYSKTPAETWNFEKYQTLCIFLCIHSYDKI
jgi:hypothetical protein